MNKYIYIIVLLLIGCNKKENNNINESFFSHKEQLAQERSINDDTEIDSLFFPELGLINVKNLVIESNRIFVRSGRELQIAVLNLNDFSLKKELQFNKGRGPGELSQILDYDILDTTLVIADNNQKKIAFFTTSGDFIREFKIKDLNPHRIKLIDRETILIYSSAIGDTLFHILDLEGNLKFSFQPREKNANLLAYEGDIELSEEKDKVLFAGYSEPIHKSYSLKSKTLNFSFSGIDSYEPSANYIKSPTGDFTVLRYSPGALYYANGLTVDKNKLFISRAHNNDATYRFIDIYGSDSGKYLHSIKTRHYPALFGLSVSNNKLYSLEISKNGEWLIVYKTP
ncbi:MAG: hypothetical protein RIE52_04460 [Balneola sp.]